MKTKYIYLLLAGIFALMSCEEDATPILELKTAAALHALSQTDITITEDNSDYFNLMWSSRNGWKPIICNPKW